MIMLMTVLTLIERIITKGGNYFPLFLFYHVHRKYYLIICGSYYSCVHVRVLHSRQHLFVCLTTSLLVLGHVSAESNSLDWAKMLSNSAERYLHL